MKTLKHLTMLLFIVVSFQTQAASQYSFEPTQGKTLFEAKGWPSLITIKGEGVGATGTLSEVNDMLTGSLAVDLNTLTTGIDLRDEHMKDKYLQVKQYPKATLTFTNLKIPAEKKGKVEFAGEMEIRGVKKEVKGTAEIIPTEKDIKVVAEFPLKLSEFNIEIPSYKGITVAEDVKVKFESQAIQKL